MRFLSREEEKEALRFIDAAAEIALGSTCLRSKCGSVIVKDGNVIGKGFNSPAGSQRKCENSKAQYHIKVTDKTCCVHAEQRAIMDALKKGSISGSRLYFIRLDDDNVKKPSGKPYCTICSKMALDSDVKEFVLWHEEGVCVYDTEEYNELSFNYG